MKKSLTAIQTRHDYYAGLVKDGWNASENTQVATQQFAMEATTSAAMASALGALFGLIPNFDFGVEGPSSPVVKASFGGGACSSRTT